MIGLLATQKYFTEYYADYSVYPDEGVEFRPVNQAYLGEHGLGNNVVAPDERFTKNELDILFGLLILASTKRISIGGQRDEFIRNRLSAMRFALKAIEFTQPDAVLEIFTMNAINAISSTMSLFPRLKVLIFSLVFRHTETPILAHLAPFLKGNQLTIFNMIFNFLTDYELTEAHIYPAVVTQAHAWFIVFNALKDKYGDHWPFAKAFEPETGQFLREQHICMLLSSKVRTL